jgi:hypothetical protein
MIKKVLRSLIRMLGYDIHSIRCVNSSSVPTSKIEFQHIGLIKHHNLNVDILRYSDKKELTDIFINKLASREYQVIERKCVVCGGG